MFNWQDRSKFVAVSVGEEEPIDRKEEGVVEIGSMFNDQPTLELYFTEMDDLCRKWLNWRRYQVVGPYPEDAEQAALRSSLGL